MYVAIKTGALFPVVKNWTQSVSRGFGKSTAGEPDDAVKSDTEKDLHRNLP